MTDNYQKLWQAMKQAHQDTPADLVTAMQGLPEVGDLPSPWETWTVIGLVRHRQRLDLWFDNLPGRLPEYGDVEHTLVPGLVGWENVSDHLHCRVIHQISGETIQFSSKSRTHFVTGDFFEHLLSLVEPQPPEKRLLELHPHCRTIRATIEDLERRGLVTLKLLEDIREGITLSRPLRKQRKTIKRFCEAWAVPDKRIWLAALIGDWIAADAASVATGNNAVRTVTALRAEECRKRRVAQLQVSLRIPYEASDALFALADLDAEELVPALRRALLGPVTEVTKSAMLLVIDRDEAALCPEVYQLLRRTDPINKPKYSPNEKMEAWLWGQSAEFLFKHNYCPDKIRAALRSADGQIIGKAVFLALKHAPDLALPLFRRALQKTNPFEAMATLGIIDSPWSRGELTAVLRDLDDSIFIPLCRAALQENHDPETCRVAEVEV